MDHLKITYRQDKPVSAKDAHSIMVKSKMFWLGATGAEVPREDKGY